MPGAATRWIAICRRACLPVCVASAALLGGAAVAVAGAGAGRPQLGPCGLPVPCPTIPGSPSTSSPPPPSTPTQTAPGSPPSRPRPPGVQRGAYDGHHGTKLYTELIVGGSTRRLAAFEFIFRQGRCSDGKRYVSGFGRALPRGAAIGSAGRVAAAATSGSAWNFTRSGRRVNGRERIRLRGRFSGDAVKGVFEDTFVAGRFSCRSGPVRFAAYLDGTGRASMRDTQLASGHYAGTVTEGYTGTTGKGPVDRFSADVFMPWRVVTRAKIHWRLFCGSSRLIKETSTLSLLPVGYNPAVDQDTFRLSRHGVTRLRKGIHGDWSFRIYGTSRFYPRTYGIQGQLNYDIDFYRGRFLLSSCFQQASFSGGGPGRSGSAP